MPQGNVTGDLRPRFSVTAGGHRHKALSRRRAFQRNARRWQTWRRECSLGRVVADRAEEGRARPYELGDVAYALRQAMSRRALDALSWLLACERGFGGKRGVVVRHADMARMLACCAKSAGDAMRELVALGLVEQRPHFVPRELHDGERPHAAHDTGSRTRRWNEHTPAYQTTTLCKDVVARREVRIAGRKSRGSSLVGKKYQPAESAAPNGATSGVRGRGRPELSFAESVLAPQKAQTAQLTVLVAGRKRSVADYNTVRQAQRTGQRLQEEPVAAKRRHPSSCLCDECLHATYADAWSAFERKGGDAPS